MFRKYSFPVLILCAVSGFTFISCATKAVGVRQDSSFKKDAIVSGKMAVGGVVSSTEVSDEELTSYATSLKNQIQDKRGDYSVVTSGVVIDKLGSDAYKSLIAGYKEKGVLGEASLKQLITAMGGTRYIVFARIDADTVEKDRRTNSSKNKQGVSIPHSVTATVKRAVSVSFNVYDTEKGIVAWSGSIEANKKKAREIKLDVGVNPLDLMNALQSGVKSAAKDKYGYPETPPLKNLLATAFKGFAKEMPK